MPEDGKPTKQYDPDAEFFRSYAIGCGVVLLAFIVGTAIIAYFWLAR